MPLFHQTMLRALRLNGQTVQHARLPNGEIANIDHLLNFALAFGNDLAGLKRNELPQLMFKIAQGVPKATNRISSHWPRSNTPFQKCFMSPTDREFIIFIRCGADPSDHLAVD